MLYRNLACAILEHGKVETTLKRAKKARSEIERLVTAARSSSLSSRRRLLQKLPYPDLVEKLLTEIGPLFKNRPGGYTRIVKLGPRRSDGAEVSRLEWVKNHDDKKPKGSKN